MCDSSPLASPPPTSSVMIVGHLWSVGFLFRPHRRGCVEARRRPPRRDRRRVLMRMDMFLLLVVFLLNQQPAGEEAGSPPTWSTDCSPHEVGSVLACEVCVCVCECVCVCVCVCCCFLSHAASSSWRSKCACSCVSLWLCQWRERCTIRDKSVCECLRLQKRLCSDLITVSLVVDYCYCCFYAC